MELRTYIMMITTFIVVIYTFSVVNAAGGPWCFACNDAFNPAICQSVIQCGAHESCSTQKTRSNQGAEFYTTSCKDNNLCTTRHKRSAAGPLLCDECCNGTLCNSKGCGATSIKTDPKQLYCLKCDFVQNPADCDQVDVCSVDKVCSITAVKKFTFSFYKLGCRAKTSCPPPTATLNKGNDICCDTDLCNSNDLGVSPSLYTTTPIPTTPKPGPPKTTFDNSNVQYKVRHITNEKLELVCHVTGGPVPTVEWTFSNGTSTVPVKSGISSGPNGDSILTIDDPNKSDTGKYTCKATNNKGTDSKDIDVDVISPPKIEGSLNNSVIVKYQDDVTLECNVTMDNETHVQWIVPFGVRSFHRNADNSLTLYNVHVENAGDYYCVAENKDGNITKAYSLAFNTSSVTTTTSPTSTTTTTTPTTTTTSTTTPTTLTSSPTTTMPTTSTVLTTTSSTTTPSTTSTTPTTSTITTPTTSTSASSTSTTTPVVCTCPTIQTTPCPTTSPFTSTSSSTSTTTTSTTVSTPTKPSSSTTLSTTTPTTSSTSTASQKPSTSTSPSSSVANPASGSPPYQQFQSMKRQLNIMICPTPVGAANSNPNVTWHRLVHDYDHKDPLYISSGAVLTISSSMSLIKTGVYECSIGNQRVAQFVIYGTLPNDVQCRSVFGDVTRTEGVVMRVVCPPCPNPLSIRPSLQPKISDFICESAIAKGLIPSYGGNVAYMINTQGNVNILQENTGNVLVP